MIVLKISEMTMHELIRLFVATSTVEVLPRAKQIIDEFEKRGYIYDPRFGDFVLCKQWNQRHGAYAPMDCAAWSRGR
ncbi:MAG: hypothetical protein ABI700_02340 [Chloroflexota bacterium]